MRPEPYLLSLVIPVFNEEDSIGLFLEACDKALIPRQGMSVEYLFVDDGSEDRTVEAIRQRQVGRKDIRLIKLSRNFGKEAALTAGLDHAKGDAVVPIDVDLQEPPELIPQFIQLWQQGYQVVYGYRSKRDSDTWFKRRTSGLFYWLFNKITEPKIPPDAGDFRLMDRKVVDILVELRERNRFMKGLLSWPGFQATGVPFERPHRAAGESAWRFPKLWKLALDGIFSFSSVPLKIWTYIGAIISLVSFVYGLMIVGLRLFAGIDAPGFASIIVAITGLGGLQLLSIGIVGEYVARIFDETKHRPIYVIDTVVEGDC